MSTRESFSSWLISIAFHAGLLLLVALNLKSCTSGLNGSGDADFHEVGIYVKQTESNQQESNTDSSTESENSSETDTTVGTDSSVLPEALPETLPAELKLPTRSMTQQIGISPSVPATHIGGGTGTVKTSGSPKSHVNAASSGKPGETTFMGLNDSGKSFVYLVDSSGSMINYNAIRVAKAELMASLASLNGTQKFQVIFYNQSQQVMSLRGGGKKKMYYATDINRTRARQFIAGIQADQGTERMGAIRLALSYQPEVMFFLTDADQPILSARELNEIKRLNNSKTRIHCIEFGRGSDLNIDNFLKKLSRANNGTYGYRDVTKFGKR